MPIKTSYQNEAFILSVPTPNHGKSYTVIPHSSIISTIKSELASADFSILQNDYKSNINGQIAYGAHIIKPSSHVEDHDLEMTIVWSNSYDKTQRFKCSIGACVKVSGSMIIDLDMEVYARKHTGTADVEAFSTIKNQIQNASSCFDRIVKVKEELKTIILTRREQAEILGRIWAEYEILTLTQLGIIKRELQTPSFDYECDPNSAWVLYNHIIHALKESHPNRWLDDHAAIHKLFMDQLFKPSANITSPEPIIDTPESTILNTVVFL